MDEDSKKILRETSVDEINQLYKDRQMSNGRRNALLQAKAQLHTEEMDITEQGAQTWFRLSLEAAQHGWDNVKEAASGAITEPQHGNLPSEFWHQFYYAGLAFIGATQIIFAGAATWSKLTGEALRRDALAMGASPGLARFLGIVADVSTGFVAIGGATQTVAKGVQAGSKAGIFGTEMAGIANRGQGGARQLELSGFGEKLAGELVKPGATKESAMKAALDAMKTDKAEIEAVKGFQLELQKSQMELPFKAIGEGLTEEGVKLNSIIEKTLGSKQVNDAAVKVMAASKESFSLEIARHARGITIEEAKKQLPELASKLGIDLDTLKNITPGGRYDPKNSWYENPKKMYGYLKALEARIDQIGPLAQQALEGNDAAKMAFAKYVTELFTGAAEGGPQYTKGFMQMLMHWDPENIAKGDIPAALQTFAYDMWYAHQTLGAKPLAQMITNASGYVNPAAIYSTARSLFLNSLLPFSALPAFIGNSYATGLAVAERATGALFSMSHNGYASREAEQMTKGLVFATMDATRAFASAYTKMGQQNLGRFANMTALNTTGQILNFPMHTVMGMDNFFSVLLTRASHYAVALREGEQAGLKGARLGQYVDYAVKNPTQSMLHEAKQLADTATFQTQLSTYAGQIAKTLQRGPGILYFPFMKSAINLGKYSWGRTPGLQLISHQLYKDIAAGGPAADAAIGRLVLSQVMAHAYMELTKNDYITGSGPLDPAVHRSWAATHVPYSAASATGWVPLSNMEPANTPMGIVADVTNILTELDNPTGEQAMMAVSFAIMKNLANNTWWQNADKLFAVVQSVEQGKPINETGLKALRAPLVAPLSSINRITHAVDPISRQARNFADEVRSKFPWSSKSVPPVRDAYGDPVVPPQAFGGSWFGLLRPVVPAFKPYETDPIKVEGSRLGVKMPAFTDHLNGNLNPEEQIVPVREEDKIGIQLSPEQVDERIQIYRTMLRHPEIGIEATLLKNPNINYNDMPEALKRAELEHRYQQYWNNAGQVLMIKNPDIGKKVMESNINAIKPLLDSNQREVMEGNMADAIKRFDTMAPEAKANLEKWGLIGNPLPDNVTFGTPMGPLINIREVPQGTPGAEAPAKPTINPGSK